MAKHNETGKRGEEIAQAYLRKKRFKIIEVNYRLERWEVDIIARDKNELVFVEVKTRFSEDFGSPGEAITLQKQRHLINAANLYALQKDYEGPIRFDVIAVHLKRGEKPDIEWIEDAFY